MRARHVVRLVFFAAVVTACITVGATEGFRSGGASDVAAYVLLGVGWMGWFMWATEDRDGG